MNKVSKRENETGFKVNPQLNLIHADYLICCDNLGDTKYLEMNHEVTNTHLKRSKNDGNKCNKHVCFHSNRSPLDAD